MDLCNDPCSDLSNDLSTEIFVKAPLHRLALVYIDRFLSSFYIHELFFIKLFALISAKQNLLLASAVPRRAYRSHSDRWSTPDRRQIRRWPQEVHTGKGQINDQCIVHASGGNRQCV